jgi:5'-nucleotidase
MTFLLTNDDGIDAPGIQALQQAIRINTRIVAPAQPFSGCGHQVTTHAPIRVEQRSENAFAVSGTPADCVRVGIFHWCRDVEWVISGINAGGNMGADVYISGTVAAVREAALHRIPAIAVSQYRQFPMEINWDLAARWTAQVLADLLSRPLKPGTFWNVNLPHLPPTSPDPEMVFCPACTQPLPLDFRIDGEWFHYTGRYPQRQRDPDSDVEVCLSGRIAITLISV